MSKKHVIELAVCPKCGNQTWVDQMLLLTQNEEVELFCVKSTKHWVNEPDDDENKIGQRIWTKFEARGCGTCGFMELRLRDPGGLLKAIRKLDDMVEE